MMTEIVFMQRLALENFDGRNHEGARFHLQHIYYSERRCCVSDQQPKSINLKVDPVHDKLLRFFQTTFKSSASAVGQETQQRLAGIGDLCYVQQE